MGDIIVRGNLVKWTMITPKNYDTKLESKNFAIRCYSCKFNYYSGSETCISNSRDPHPVQSAKFSIDYHRKASFKPSLPITILISSSCETFKPQRCYLTGESNQIIWSTGSSSDLLNTSMTLEMVIQISKVDKCIQTGSYMDANVSLESLSGDFIKLLNSNLNTDAEIKCGGHYLKVHKIVLSARSEVFKAMLQSDMQEARTGVIEMQDMDVNYFHDFIEFLYTGVMRELTFDKAKALYEAGDKYAVRSLVNQCSEYLQDILSRENAFESFTVADAHSDQKLKDTIINYFLKEEIYLEDEFWDPFCESFPKVAIDVYKRSYKD